MKFNVEMNLIFSIPLNFTVSLHIKVQFLSFKFLRNIDCNKLLQNFKDCLFLNKKAAA